MCSFKFHKFSEELFRRTSATIEDKICHVKYGFKVNESWYEQCGVIPNYPTRQVNLSRIQQNICDGAFFGKIVNDI